MSNDADSSAPYEFEEVGVIMAEATFGIHALRTSGSSAGGDGGADGWFYDRRGCQYKIACSVCNKANLNEKIRKEIASTQDGYVFFCTNQEISGKDRKKYKIINPNIEFADINDIVSVTEHNCRLKEIFGIPIYESMFYLDELRQRHQFIGSENRIAKYIERKVIVRGNDKKEMSVPFIEWAKDKRSQLKLLEAPAGYGKTSLMEQLYMNILNDDSLRLPPLYYDLKNFDGIDKLIDKIVGRGDGFEKYNFFFIFDGLDEIPYNIAKQLILQIDDLLTISTNHNAMVILSVRKNEYQSELFDGRIAPEIAQIKALDTEDIKEIIARRGFRDEEATYILSSLESDSFDNAFYVSSMLDFYAETKGVPASRIDLFEYLLKKDKDMLSRKHRIDERKFNSAVLYVSLTKKSLPAGIEIYRDLPISSLNFSHRNIQEYAAAKALSQLSCDEIIFLISSEGIIVPQAKNMFGFLLNILVETDFSKMKILMEYFSENKLNLDVLLMIEPSRLLPYIRQKILHEALTYYVNNTYYDIPNSLANFICDVPESGYKELLSFVKDCDESHITKALMITYQIVVHRPEVCPQETAYYLYDMFLREIAENTRKTTVLDNLAYILRHIDGKLPDLKISAVERILSIAENSIYDPEFVMSLLVVLKTGFNHLTESDMDRVINCFFAISKENHMCAHSAPLQIKAGYKTRSSIIYCTTPFYDIVYSYILANHSFFFSILGKYKVFLKDNERMIDGYDPFSGLIARAAADLFVANCFEEEGIKELIDVILLEYRFGYHHDQNICTELFKINKSGPQLLCNILIVFSKSKSDCKQRNVFAFESIINKLFTDEMFFGIFRNLTGESFDENIRFYYQYNSLSILPISETIKNHLPKEIHREIEKQEERNERAKNEEKKHRKHIEESFHIVFDDEEFREQSCSIFDEMKSSGRRIYELKHTPDYHSYSYVNEFLITTIGASHCSDFEDFISFWFDRERHNLNILFYLMWYLESYNLSYSLLREEEKHRIYSIAEKIFKMPFQKGYLGFKLMSILMRQPELMEQMIKLTRIASFPIEYFIDIGMPINLKSFTATSNPYELYSIDYLENYMNHLDIAEYLINHFRMMLTDNICRFIAIGYMTKHKSSLLQHEMKTMLKPILIEFINDNLSETGLFCGYNFLPDFGINLNDFDIRRLSEHISIENETNPDFVFCTSYEILSYFSRNGSDDDKELAATCFSFLFDKRENIPYKKRLAEEYISVKSDNYKINHWYTEYCLSPEGMISIHCDNDHFVFSSLDSLPDIECMIISAVSGDDEKSSILFRIAVNSYKAIFGNLISAGADAKLLNPILSSLKNVRKKTSNYSVIKLLNDMEMTIALNLYSEPNWPLLQKLFH